MTWDQPFANSATQRIPISRRFKTTYLVITFLRSNMKKLLFISVTFYSFYGFLGCISSPPTVNPPEASGILGKTYRLDADFYLIGSDLPHLSRENPNDPMPVSRDNIGRGGRISGIVWKGTAVRVDEYRVMNDFGPAIVIYSEILNGEHQGRHVNLWFLIDRNTRETATRKFRDDWVTEIGASPSQLN